MSLVCISFRQSRGQTRHENLMNTLVKRKLVLQDWLGYKIKEQGRVDLSLFEGQKYCERMHIE